MTCRLCGTPVVWIDVSGTTPSGHRNRLLVDEGCHEQEVPHAETCHANPFGPDIHPHVRRTLARHAVLDGAA